MNGVTFVCARKDIVCGDRPENWCDECPKRPMVAVAPHAAAGPYPTAMRPATNQEARWLLGSIHHPGTSCRAKNRHGQCGCEWGKCALSTAGVTAAPVSVPAKAQP
jgi:hypothetical protein